MTGYQSKRAMAQDKLAQPEQEPQICCGEYDTCLRACTPRGEHLAQPAQQEPVAWMKASDTEWSISFFEEDGYVPLYTTPQAQRKPLTINEVEQILAQHNYEIHGDRARYIVRMTEAAHGIKEKNT